MIIHLVTSATSTHGESKHCFPINLPNNQSMLSWSTSDSDFKNHTGDHLCSKEVKLLQTGTGPLPLAPK